MTHLRERRFTILDAMLLIAATGVGLAACRYWVPQALKTFGSKSPLPVWMPPNSLKIVVFTIISWPLPAMWSLTLLVMNLRKPRRPWRRIARNAGVLASLGVVVTAAFWRPG